MFWERAMSTDRWADARRLEAWAGEGRVNLLRALSVIVFYGHHLYRTYLAPQDLGLTPEERARYHLAVTAIVLAWILEIFVLFLCLSRRWVPPALKYLASFSDLILVSALLIANPAGPHSPLVFIYFAVVAAAPLRLSLRLVQATTFGAMLAAVLMMGYYVYFRIGSEVYYQPGSEVRVSHTAEVLFLLALGLCGLFAGQSVRQARRLVEGYPVVVEEPRTEPAA
jgi:hypothetical protein